MTPRQKAEAYYAAIPEGPTLDEDMRRHAAYGVLVDTEDLFLMARPVSLESPISAITDPRVPFDPQHSDCWHIHFLAGSMVKACAAAPYVLPNVSMERHRKASRLVILDFLELHRLITCTTRHTATN